MILEMVNLANMSTLIAELLERLEMSNSDYWTAVLACLKTWQIEEIEEIEETEDVVRDLYTQLGQKIAPFIDRTGVLVYQPAADALLHQLRYLVMVFVLRNYRGSVH